MDTAELIRKCQTVVLKEEEEDIVNFMGRMKIKREEMVANYLVGKVLLSQSINREGLKAAMQQVWKTVKEVKIDQITVCLGLSNYLFWFLNFWAKFFTLVSHITVSVEVGSLVLLLW